MEAKLKYNELGNLIECVTLQYITSSGAYRSLID